VAGEIYNICSVQAYQIDDMISMAAEVAGVSIELEISPQLLRENDKVQLVIQGDPSKLCSLGWKPQVSIRELLAQMIDGVDPLKSTVNP
jgi:GDP-4-dehydro-6-deoxy-D-mannose reductase